VPFDPTRTFGELVAHVADHFGLAKCRLIGLRPGPRVPKQNQGASPLREFQLKPGGPPKRLRVIGTSREAAQATADVEKHARRSAVKRGRQEDNWHFVYEAWQCKLVKEAYNYARSMGYGETRRFLRGLTDGAYETLRGHRWSELDPVERVPCRDVLRACIAGGQTKLLEYCIQKHEATDDDLGEALVQAAKLGLRDIISALLKYLSGDPRGDLPRLMMDAAIRNMHLPLLESIQNLGQSKVDPFECYSLHFSRAMGPEFWPVPRELIAFLLRQGCYAGPVILKSLWGSHIGPSELANLFCTIEANAMPYCWDIRPVEAVCHTCRGDRSSSGRRRPRNGEKEVERFPFCTVEEATVLALRIAVAKGRDDLFPILLDEHTKHLSRKRQMDERKCANVRCRRCGKSMDLGGDKSSTTSTTSTAMDVDAKETILHSGRSPEALQWATLQGEELRHWNQLLDQLSDELHSTNGANWIRERIAEAKNEQKERSHRASRSMPLIFFASEVAVRCRDQVVQPRVVKALQHLLWKSPVAAQTIEKAVARQGRWASRRQPLSHDAKCELVRALDFLHAREVEAMNICFTLKRLRNRYPTVVAYIVAEYVVGSDGTSEVRLRETKIKLVDMLAQKTEDEKNQIHEIEDEYDEW